jgi:hypothetical protein
MIACTTRVHSVHIHYNGTGAHEKQASPSPPTIILVPRTPPPASLSRSQDPKNVETQHPQHQSTFHAAREEHITTISESVLSAFIEQPPRHHQQAYHHRSCLLRGRRPGRHARRRDHHGLRRRRRRRWARPPRLQHAVLVYGREG